MISIDSEQKTLAQFDIEKIGFEPGPYCMSFGFNNEILMKSIQIVGLLNPPLLVKGREGRMEVVSGYRRINAYETLGRRKIACLDISAACLSAKELLLLNFFDNLATREMNPVEKGMVLQRLRLYFSDEQVKREYMPLLGLASRDSVLQEFLSLSELTQEQRQGMIDFKISMQAVSALMELDSGSRSIVMDSIININLNFNQQIQFIELIRDISMINNIDAFQVLEKIKCLTAENTTAVNRPQKAKIIMEALRSMRYPRLAKAEKEFERQTGRLNLPKGARIRHTPGFETEHCQLTIDFKNGQELKKTMLSIAQLEDLEKLCVFKDKE